MHVRVRFSGHPEVVLVVESKLTKIEQFRRVITAKFNVEPKLQQLIYGGKLLEDGYTFHDYNIKLNDVIQLIKRAQPVDNASNIVTKNPSQEQVEKKNFVYKDATSSLYKVGDFVDAKDNEGGYWLEGTISRILLDPETHSDANNSASSENCTDNKPHENILVKVNLGHGPSDEEIMCKLSEIRPRARSVIDPKDIQTGQIVMINCDIDDPGQVGYWYDFKVDEVKARRKNYELSGTLYLGLESIPQDNTNILVKDKIYKIEEPVPLSDRSDEYNKIAAEEPPKRSQPIHCKKCGDDELRPCKYCGCYVCASKESPEQIILCDECDNGFHLKCLEPPLTAIPDEDWYCHSCRRDPNDVVAPGAAKQTKKTKASESTRDWGRGMACIGKTKDSDMPLNHFGPIPGLEVGMIWRYRMQLSENGLHRPSVSGIHGRDAIGAFSIVLSGGYEDDVDNGNEFTYTGSGGRDLSGNKRTAGQSCDQKFTRENRALARNCAAKPVSDKGGDAGDNWRQGKPVRVMRSYKMAKAFPKYAPREGIRYDGIYKVVKYYPETGLSGFVVYKYLLRRDDPSPAPWEPGAKQFSIVYPDGYLEAEAQKKLLKQKKNSTEETQVLSENKPMRKTANKETGKKSNGARKAAAKRRRVSSSEASSPSTSESSDDDEEIIKNNRKSRKSAKTKKAKLDESQEKPGTDTPKSTKNENKSKKSRKSSSPGDNKIQTKLTFTPVAKKKAQKTSPTQGDAGETIKNTSETLNSAKSVTKTAELEESQEKRVKLGFAKIDTPKSYKNENKSKKGYKVSSPGDGKIQTKLSFAPVAKKAQKSHSQSFPTKELDDSQERPVEAGSAKIYSPKSNENEKSTKGRISSSPGDGKIQTKLAFTSVAKKAQETFPQASLTEDSKFGSEEESNKENAKLSASELEAVQSDQLNAKLWEECLEICRRQSKTQFIEHVMEVFRCIICQGPAVSPVTTPCLHNFCLSCMKRAFKTTGSKCCPYCRQTLADFELATNQQLTTALRTLMPGYDAGQK